MSGTSTLELIEVKFNIKLSRTRPASRLAFVYLCLIIVDDDERPAILRASGIPNVTDYYKQ
jgi:hypothetical protein